MVRQLEDRFQGRPFVAVGVHSAKFTTERDPENVRQAVLREGVEHPVVVDSEHRIWSAYAVRAWPTVVLVDAEGRIAHVEAGEPDPGALAGRVEALLEEAAARGVLAQARAALPRAPVEPAGLLRFPSKVRALGDRLVVADTGHHRLLVLAPDGLILDRVGSGDAGDRDGAFEAASFRSPRGLAVLGGTLYVADTGNHRVRAVDLAGRTVRTVAGTGQRGTGRGARGADAREVPLRSPWDLVEVGDGLLVAMAGSHQIWALEPGQGLLGPYAGTGAESHVDGPTREATFAQPSGLCRSGAFVFVADSETSSVRAIDLGRSEVTTVLGRDLFDWGDRDGPVEEALLQHPLDVAVEHGHLYVADTYNHKIKRVDLQAATVATLAGDGTTGPLHEPQGLCVLGERLYVADTNHHRLRVLALDDPDAVLETLPLSE